MAEKRPESLKNKKEIDAVVREENKVTKERETAETLLESELNTIDVDDDILW